jgi:hypothetical protein
MRTIILILFAVCASRTAVSQFITEYSPYMQQAGIYFSSDRVTSDGVGVGIGCRFVHGKHLVGQADVNLLWGNGNAVATRLAIGYQRKGLWSPAILGTFNLLCGHRTEILSESGERPASPVWVAGLRAVPLKFANKHGFVSAFEFGYGIGPDNGRCIELTILSIGIAL